MSQALLEKAMKARQAQVESSSADNSPVPPQRQAQPQPVSATAGFLAPTKAFIVQSAPAKTAKQVLLTDEEVARAEEAKHEQVASMRRRFKEQHKKILQGLTSRNKEGEKKVRSDDLIYGLLVNSLSPSLSLFAAGGRAAGRRAQEGAPPPQDRAAAGRAAGRAECHEQRLCSAHFAATRDGDGAAREEGLAREEDG